MSEHGYFGIGVCLPKTGPNVGTLLRSAFAFGAAFVFTVGRRYPKQATDTLQAWKHIPLYHYIDADEFLLAIPHACVPIAVERMDEARPLPEFSHPERALYILGPEDGSVPASILKHCKATVQIPSAYCLNVAVAGSIVMYDRIAKL